MNSEAYKTILSAQIQPNAAKLIAWCFKEQMNNEPKYSAKSNSSASQGK